MSRRLWTDAKNDVACEKCGAAPGEDCRMPSGRRKWPPHVEREIACVNKNGIEPYRTVASSGPAMAS